MVIERRTQFLFLLLLALFAVLVGPVSAQDDADDEAASLANVRAVTLIERQGDPMPYVLAVDVVLPNGCTRLDADWTQSVTAETLSIALTTNIPDPFVMCTQALVPVQRLIPLDISDLEPGEYTADVNGMTVEFTLDEATIEDALCFDADPDTGVHLDARTGFCLTIPAGYTVQRIAEGGFSLANVFDTAALEAMDDADAADALPEPLLRIRTEDYLPQTEAVLGIDMADAETLTVNGSPIALFDGDDVATDGERLAFKIHEMRVFLMTDLADVDDMLWQNLIDSLRFLQPEALAEDQRPVRRVPGT